MANLDPQVQVKLIEISKDWAEKAGTHNEPFNIPKAYPKTFDTIYRELAKTVAEAIPEK